MSAMDDRSSCQCDCDQVLKKYGFTACNISQKSIIRTTNAWISYLNTSKLSGYLIYQNCPSDYCFSPRIPVSINLNIHNGSDMQCAYNRTGILCGTCASGFGVSLSTSHCVACHSYWRGLLIVHIVLFIIGGIGLVAMLLVLNLTVAVGTFNAIIFYANVIVIARSSFFSSDINFAFVLISWLNLDVGFDYCFLNGMDTYTKTWFQLLFPAYIFLLVISVIKLSYHFTAFGRLIGRKDPVATLATLILLSYTKLLNVVITVFSSATLNYPDGSSKTLWLPDATIDYLRGKHIILFCVAVLILLVGIGYTIVLFSWHWIPFNPEWKVLRWIGSLKLWLFLDTYYAPYIEKHRYWTGLLLLVRLSLNLVSALDLSGDPRKQILSIIIVTSILLFYKSGLNIQVYKLWIIDALETFTFFHLTILAVLILYTFDTSERQADITQASMGITVGQFVLIICYHLVKFTKLSKFGETIKNKAIELKSRRQYSSVQYVQLSEIPTVTSSVVSLSELLSQDNMSAEEKSCHDQQSVQNPEPRTSDLNAALYESDNAE